MDTICSIHIRNMVTLLPTRCDEVDDGGDGIVSYSEESKNFVISESSVWYLLFLIISLKFL